MEVHGSGLTLRTPVSADAADVAESVLLSLEHLGPWMPWATSDYDEQAAARWIAGEFGDEHRFLIVSPDGSHIGSCGLNRLTEDGAANLGYWIRRDQCRRGYATSATRALARHGLNDLGLERIEIVMSVANVASRGVAEAAGATYEGKSRRALRLADGMHDIDRFSFIAADLAP